MSFDAKKFQTTYKEGDLFYGLAGPRQEFMKNRFPTLNDQQLQLANIISGLTIDAYNIGDKPQQQSVPRDNKAFVNYFMGKKKNQQIYNAAFQGPTGEVNVKNAVIRRKCKAGLEWALLSSSNPDRTVHFCLDGLGVREEASGIEVADWNGVVGKDWADLSRGFQETSMTGLSIEHKVRAITNAELRWIYRNRNNQRVANGVQFWRGNVPVLPPWVEGEGGTKLQGQDPFADWKIWQQYKPKVNHIARDEVGADLPDDAMDIDSPDADVDAMDID